MLKRTNPRLSYQYYISSFIAGLKDSIQYHLQCHQPTSLSQAYWFAKRVEKANPPVRKFNTFPNSATTTKQWPKDKEAHNQNIVELRVASKCFKCREPWVPGHTKVCKGKRLYSIILVENPEGKEEVAVVEDGNSSEEPEFHDAEQLPTVQISMHALTGTPSKAHTFTLKLKIGGLTATALIYSGSDVSIKNTQFAVKSRCQISDIEVVKVATANGHEMLSNTASLNCLFTIQGHEFSKDLRLLTVQGYDVILGADWIYRHNPVGLDLRRRESSICKNGGGA